MNTERVRELLRELQSVSLEEIRLKAVADTAWETWDKARREVWSICEEALVSEARYIKARDKRDCLERIADIETQRFLVASNRKRQIEKILSESC